MRYALLALLLACSGPSAEDDGSDDPCDEDGDGWPSLECGGDDCCDVDDTSHPGAGFAATPNACGSWDRDCSGEVEREGGPSMCGAGSTVSSSEECYNGAIVNSLGQTNGGWLGAQPECGEVGQLSGPCVYYGGDVGCVEELDAPPPAVQPCR